MAKPARAKKLDITRPLHTVPKQQPPAKQAADKHTRSKAELAALREEAKAAAKSSVGKQGKAAKLAVGQVEAKFGNDDYRKAMRERHPTYKGVQDSPFNVLPGAGPVQ